jgi:c-di-GMP-binding flagellar brake protein YcgR
MITTLIFIVIIAGIAVLILSQSNKNDKKSWIHFFAKGKDAGFSIGEIELLRRLAIKSSLTEPSSLFWSQDQLDRCIRNLVRSTRLAGNTDQSTQDFLSKLYDYRKKIEMEKPKIKNGIADTRLLEEGQTARIMASGVGVFPSKILKNTGGYLTIARPTNAKLPLSFSWIGHKISVYLWREDDAGYVFDTEVQDEVFSKGNPALKIGHGNKLFRTQKRTSIRIKTHKAAFLYILGHDDPSDTIEMDPGLKCFVENISDTGCGVLIGGKSMEGIRIKIQFILNNSPICLSGTVRSVEYNEKENKSLLHMEADTMKLQTRNLILGEVFGMLPEEEEDLPFRVMEDEAAEENDDVYTPGSQTTAAFVENVVDGKIEELNGENEEENTENTSAMAEITL